MHIFKFVLFPFSLLYSVVVYLRNKVYDMGWMGAQKFSVSTLTVGNLSFGGTGKTPMILWLLKEVFNARRPVVLSRGYGRKSKGFRWVNNDSTPLDVGDEPLQIFKLTDRRGVAVCEDRRTGIEKIVNDVYPDIILLDDAFQHRKVIPKASILLTTYLNLFYNDCYFPMGRLRDHKTQANRADIIVVTKCPEEITLEEAKLIKKKISQWSSASIFFASLEYRELDKEALSELRSTKNLLVTGIADPTALVSYLNGQEIPFTHSKFKDHYNYQKSDFSNLDRFDRIITTTKDQVKLESLIPKSMLKVIEVEHSICFNQKNILINLILEKTLE